MSSNANKFAFSSLFCGITDTSAYYLAASPNKHFVFTWLVLSWYNEIYFDNRKQHSYHTMNSKNYKEGLHDGIPIGLGYFAVSFAFGMTAVAGGLKIAQAVFISATNLTSAGQFAGLDIIFGDGAYWEMALTQLIINLRYCLMSFSLAQKIDDNGNPLHRFAVAFGVTDEIFGISAARSGRLSPFYCYGAMSVAIPGWVLGTLCGAISGNLLPAPIMSALSVAIYGMFLAIIIPPAKSDRAVLLVVLAAMACSSAFYYLPLLNRVSSGIVIIIVTVGVAAIAAALKPISTK